MNEKNARIIDQCNLALQRILRHTSRFRESFQSGKPLTPQDVSNCAAMIDNEALAIQQWLTELEVK